MKPISSITQIPGIYAGHCTRPGDAATGCTVIICPAGATGGVDVRGGAPATRETDLLRPEETVQVLHAVVLSGGSAYGLSAACGVAEELERRGIGLDVGVGVVPIVSGACLFDLGVGDAHERPTVEDGRAATQAALVRFEAQPAECDTTRPAVEARADDASLGTGRPAPTGDSRTLERGNVGAGAGCTVGKLAGPTRAMKCGLGEAVEQAGELVCGAVSAVNAVGNVVDPACGKPLAGMLNETGDGIASVEDALLAFAAMPLDGLRTNTTISCVVTNAKLTKAEATKVAQMAADAYAHTIRPTHTTNDGDTVFVMATGEVPCAVDIVGLLATRALEGAIVDAATSAESAYGYKAARDL